MFSIKEKILLLIAIIFFIFATLSTYYFFKSFDEKIYIKSSEQELDF